jgi:hypothetical protein
MHLLPRGANFGNFKNSEVEVNSFDLMGNLFLD